MDVKFCILLSAIILSFGGNGWAQHEMHDSHHAKQEKLHQHSGDDQTQGHEEVHGDGTAAVQEAKTEKSPSVVYSCPMHPEVRQDKAGRCPKCGMNLEVNKEAKEETQEAEEKESDHKAHQHSTH